MELLDLYRYADDAAVTVDGFALQKREALALRMPDGACCVAIDPLRLTSTADEKTKLAHELGHCATGSFYNRWAARDVRQMHENRADKWAIERLVPRSELETAVAAGHTELWDLAELFGVTEPFMRKAVCWHKYHSLAVEQYL